MARPVTGAEFAGAGLDAGMPTMPGIAPVISGSATCGVTVGAVGLGASVDWTGACRAEKSPISMIKIKNSARTAAARCPGGLFTDRIVRAKATLSHEISALGDEAT